jgi:predicted HAD superfamily Cof-like phosphohydrolase
MIDYVAKLEEFHKKYNHYTGSHAHVPPERIVELRCKLINEEMIELFNELNYDWIQGIALSNKADLVEVADALGDILYVVFGTALAFGIDIDAVFTEIHRSNMTKSTETNNYGKTIKGPDWEPPNLKPIIFGEMI